MTNRDAKIKFIKSEMKRLDWNDRALSMYCFNKPDRVRNLFDGKANSWRSDTEEAIMDVFKNNIFNPRIRNNKKKPKATKQSNGALLEIMKGIATIIASSGETNKSFLQQLLKDSEQELRTRKQSDEAEEISRLLQSLSSAPSSQDIQAPHKHHAHPHQKYPTEKNS